MDKIQTNSIVNVQAFKHNGLLYRQWNGAKVLEVSPMSFVLLMYKTKVEEVNGQRWTVREPMIWHMPRDSFYNTTALIRKSGIYFYTNLASPSFYEDGSIKFIDYDLDIKAYPGKEVRVVDKKEFAVNREKYNYSPRLIEHIMSAQEEVLALIQKKEDFFNLHIIYSYIDDLIKSKDIPLKLKPRKNTTREGR